MDWYDWAFALAVYATVQLAVSVGWGVLFNRPPRIDERTGRPVGDHGTALDAIEFALELVRQGGGPGDGEDFLRAWQHGDLDEYPEFYEALRADESDVIAHGRVGPFASLTTVRHHG